MSNIQRFEMYFVNAYLIEVRGGFILIDTGLPRFRELIESKLLSAGCKPGQLKLIIATHGDVDHIGNCVALKNRYGCPIAMHRDDAHLAEKEILVRRKVKNLKQKITFILRRITGKKMGLIPFKPDLYLTDGQNLDEFGFRATVIHIPGHTQGSIGILTREGELFSGDTLINRKKPVTATIIQNKKYLKNSLQRLQSLPFSFVYPGHGKPFRRDELHNF